ncbi:MAG: YwiC-like family protein [Arachnia sp.]
MHTTSARPDRRFRSRGKAAGWMPNQHGAWAMLVVPWLLGFAEVLHSEGPVISSLLLLVTWLAAYFAFFAVSQWLKSRRKPRYLPAVRTYAVVTTLLGVGVLALEPEWIQWGIVIAPLLLVTLWLSWRRRDRSLSAGALTVAATSLVPMIMNSDGLWPWTVAPAVVGISLVCFGYFFGTVFYVKTIVRERGSQGWVIASVLVHLQCVWICPQLPEVLPRVALAAFFALMTLRAWLVPWLGPLRGRNVSARTVGIGEFGSTVLLLAVLLAS